MSDDPLMRTAKDIVGEPKGKGPKRHDRLAHDYQLIGGGLGAFAVGVTTGYALSGALIPWPNLSIIIILFVVGIVMMILGKHLEEIE